MSKQQEVYDSTKEFLRRIILSLSSDTHFGYSYTDAGGVLRYEKVKGNVCISDRGTVRLECEILLSVINNVPFVDRHEINSFIKQRGLEFFKQLKYDDSIEHQNFLSGQKHIL